LRFLQEIKYFILRPVGFLGARNENNLPHMRRIFSSRSGAAAMQPHMCQFALKGAREKMSHMCQFLSGGGYAAPYVSISSPPKKPTGAFIFTKYRFI